MEDQRQIVNSIDAESTSAAARMKNEGLRISRAAMAARLIFIPPGSLVKGLVVEGGLFKGVAGLKRSVNAWALAFITQAKLYEALYGDDAPMREKLGEHLP